MRLLIKSFLMLIFATGMLAAQPKLKIVGGDTHDWGDVDPSQSPLKTDIVLKNIGTDTLHLVNVRPGCGCTTAKDYKSILAPDEQTTIKVELNISNYSGDVTKTISIRTNEPTASMRFYKLKANVIRPLNSFPRFMNFAGSNVGEENTAKVILKNSTDKSIKIKKIEFDPEGLKINIKEGDEIPANGDLTVEAKYTPKIPGRITGRIRFKTDNEKVPVYEVRIYGSTRQQPPKRN